MTQLAGVVVVAKAPVAGRVKTRLCPPLSPEQAAEVAAAALADTLDAVTGIRDVRRVIALDGEPGTWVPQGFEVVAQPSGGLDARIAAAFAETSGPAVLIGMDTPQVQPQDIEVALATLAGGTDAVVGPASDGGFWLLGLREPDPRAVLGVPMSTAHTGRAQVARLHALGLTTAVMRELRDIDHYSDALAVAAAEPTSRVAAILQTFEPPVAVGARR